MRYSSKRTLVLGLAAISWGCSATGSIVQDRSPTPEEPGHWITELRSPAAAGRGAHATLTAQQATRCSFTSEPAGKGLLGLVRLDSLSKGGQAIAGNGSFEFSRGRWVVFMTGAPGTMRERKTVAVRCNSDDVVVGSLREVDHAAAPERYLAASSLHCGGVDGRKTITVWWIDLHRGFETTVSEPAQPSNVSGTSTQVGARSLSEGLRFTVPATASLRQSTVSWTDGVTRTYRLQVFLDQLLLFESTDRVSEHVGC
jgi:hypothetical protein